MINPTLTLFAEFQIPTQFKDNLAYGLMMVIGVAAVFCVIKCIQGADMLDQGEDGKKKIYSGLAVGVAPWLGLAAFKATGLDEKIGFTLAPTSLQKLDSKVIDVLTLALWAVIGIAAIWCVIKCVNGANELEHGENGKKKIFSGLAIGAAPWLAISALKLSGFWEALGIQLT
jgi:uncharacterized membrane protein YuzA (DUF378 family)